MHQRKKTNRCRKTEGQKTIQGPDLNYNQPPQKEGQENLTAKHRVKGRRRKGEFVMKRDNTKSGEEK